MPKNNNASTRKTLRDQENLINYLERVSGIVYLSDFIKVANISENKAKFVLLNYGFAQVETGKPGYKRLNSPDPNRYG